MSDPPRSGFALDTADSYLDTIMEAGSEDRSPASTFLSEEELHEARTKKTDVAASAKREMREVADLLKKMETGTDTRRDKERLVAKKAELSRLKREIEETSHTASTAERRMLEESTRKAEEDFAIALRKKAVRSVVRSVCDAECVDLAFIVDCTSSMGPHIESVRNSVKKIVRSIKTTNGNLKLRLSFVCYRDFCDGSDRFDVLDFVPSVDEFEDFVSNLRAIGGGDAPEDMAGGIQKANCLSWQHPTRVVFLIADAPCHGKTFHTLGDDYPRGSPGVDIVAQLKQLMGRVDTKGGSMSIYFTKITDCTNMMLGRFQEKGVELEVLDLKETDMLTASVTRGVRHSIFKTISVTGGATRALSIHEARDSISVHKSRHKLPTKPRLKAYRITARKPSFVEWRKRDAMTVQVFRNKPVKRMSELQAPLGVGKVKKSMGRTDLVDVKGRTDLVDKSTMFMRRAANLFAEGQIRIAFHGQLARRQADLGLEKQEMILKSFKRVGTGLNDRDQYLKQMEISNIVHFLASEYNKSHFRPKHCAKIHCLPCCVVEETSDTNEKEGNRRFCAEAPLPIPPGAEFIKYSNNTGYWNDDELDESLLRFSDYTYRSQMGTSWPQISKVSSRKAISTLPTPLSFARTISASGTPTWALRLFANASAPHANS